MTFSLFIFLFYFSILISGLCSHEQAKVLVYGVLYGQSAAALAQQLGVRTGAAYKIRETVLATYPKLRDYIQQVKEECKING